MEAIIAPLHLSFHKHVPTSSTAKFPYRCLYVPFFKDAAILNKKPSWWMYQMATSEIVFCDASLIFVAKDQLEMHMAAITLIGNAGFTVLIW